MSKAWIRREIRRKKSEVTACDRAIDKIDLETGRVNNQIDVWTRMQNLLNGDESTSAVVTRNQYEGGTAIKNCQNYIEGVGIKRRREMEANDLMDDSRNLKRNIRYRIAQLKEEISYLYSCLDDD